MATDSVLNKRTPRVIEGWLLHKRPLRETSLQVFFFTQEHGLFEGSYRGGRAPKKQSFLQAFTPLSLTVSVSSDRYYVGRVETVLTPMLLQGTALFAGLYLNELLFYALGPFDPVPVLFQAYVETIKKLQNAGTLQVIETLLRRFEWVLLSACGQKMSFTKVAYADDLIQPNQTYHFMANAGFIPDAGGNFMGEDILALANDDLSDLKYLKVAKLIARQAIDGLLGGRILQTRQLFKASRS